MPRLDGEHRRPRLGRRTAQHAPRDRPRRRRHALRRRREQQPDRGVRCVWQLPLRLGESRNRPRPVQRTGRCRRRPNRRGLRRRPRQQPHPAVRRDRQLCPRLGPIRHRRRSVQPALRRQEFDAAGTFIRKWGTVGSTDGQLHSPRGLAADSAGNVYVSDTSNNRIQVFGPTGTFLAKWGSEGGEPGQFSFPLGVAVGPTGNVYVSEEYPNDRIQVFGEEALPPTVADLIEAVDELPLPDGTRSSLEAKLHSAEAAFERGADAAAANQLAAFAHQLEALSGKKLDSTEVAALIAEAGEVTGDSPCA